MDLTDEQYNIQSSNEEFISPNVLQLRLDTNELIDKIRAFLAGGRITYYRDSEGNIKSKFVSEGKPLCNDLGVQSLVSWISMLINSSTVQGNWDDLRFNSFLERSQKNLAKNILINAPRYQIDRQDRSFIIKGIIGLLEMFASRLLNNEERKSYSQSLGTRVANLVSPEKKRGVL